MAQTGTGQRSQGGRRQLRPGNDVKDAFPAVAPRDMPNINTCKVDYCHHHNPTRARHKGIALPRLDTDYIQLFTPPPEIKKAKIDVTQAKQKQRHTSCITTTKSSLPQWLPTSSLRATQTQRSRPWSRQRKPRLRVLSTIVRFYTRVSMTSSTLRQTCT